MFWFLINVTQCLNPGTRQPTGLRSLGESSRPPKALWPSSANAAAPISLRPAYPVLDDSTHPFMVLETMAQRCQAEDATGASTNASFCCSASVQLARPIIVLIAALIRYYLTGAAFFPAVVILVHSDPSGSASVTTQFGSGWLFDHARGIGVMMPGRVVVPPASADRRNRPHPCQPLPTCHAWAKTAQQRAEHRHLPEGADQTADIWSTVRRHRFDHFVDRFIRAPAGSATFARPRRMFGK